MYSTLYKWRNGRAPPPWGPNGGFCHRGGRSTVWSPGGRRVAATLRLVKYSATTSGQMDRAWIVEADPDGCTESGGYSGRASRDPQIYPPQCEHGADFVGFVFHVSVIGGSNRGFFLRRIADVVEWCGF